MRKERQICAGEDTDGNLPLSVAAASALEQCICFTFFSYAGNVLFAELFINIKIH